MIVAYNPRKDNVVHDYDSDVLYQVCRSDWVREGEAPAEPRFMISENNAISPDAQTYS